MASGEGNWPPALLTRPSMRPYSFSTVAMVSLTCSSLRMSQTMERITLPPSWMISSSTLAKFFLHLRPVMTTCAPSAASSWAVQRPMPEPPPVTMMTPCRQRQSGVEKGVVLHHGCKSLSRWGEGWGRENQQFRRNPFTGMSSNCWAWPCLADQCAGWRCRHRPVHWSSRMFNACPARAAHRCVTTLLSASSQCAQYPDAVLASVRRRESMAGIPACGQ
jgi:hypothetical protein